jgi:hypothetical protein
MGSEKQCVGTLAIQGLFHVGMLVPHWPLLQEEA